MTGQSHLISAKESCAWVLAFSSKLVETQAHDILSDRIEKNLKSQCTVIF